jgi:hypothetical protein
MADIDVYDDISISEYTYQTTYIADVSETIAVTDSASMSRRIVCLNEKVLLPFRESLTFNGEILQSHNRTEQRIAWRRGFPDRRFSIKIVLESSSEISKFENKIHSWLKQSWSFPLWPLAETHTSTITAGDSSITVDTTYAGYQSNGFAMIWQDRDTYDLVTIASLTDTTLILKETPNNTYAGTKYIMPCISARCLGARLNWMEDKATVDLSFRLERVSDVIDFTADMVYDNKVVIKDPPISMRNRIDYQNNPDFAVLDAGTGLFDIVSNSDFNVVTQPYTWHCESKQEAWELRQLLHYINGQQKGLLIPTFKNDLQLSQSVGSGDTDIYIVNANLFEDMGYNDLRTYIAFRPEGSDIIVRKVTAINPVSSTEEEITIDVAPGTAFDANDYLCWVDLCRLSNPTINIEWYQRGKCLIQTVLTRIKTYDDSIAELYSHDEVEATDSADRIFNLGMNVNENITVEEDETVSVS